jgi:amino acid permease
MKRGSTFYAAIATLTGTIIGAGVLGIPYVVQKSGFLTGTLLLLVLGIATVLLYLYTGEIVLRTKGNHQLTGYSEIYLGKTGKVLMTASMILVIYGALIAYLIGEGEALAAIFNNYLSPFWFSIIFFLIFSSLVFIGLKAIQRSELLLSAIVILIILAISAFAITKVNLSNLTEFNLLKIFYPYGVILFALAGAVAIPEMKEELKNQKKLLKKAIIIGALIPIILYFFFTLVTVGVTGAKITEIATIGLGNLLGKEILIFGNLFAVFAMATSFLTLGLGLKEMYHYDFKINKHLAFAATIIPPLLIFLFVERSFIKTIGISGGVFTGIEAILIVLMFNKAKKLGNRNPEYQIKKSNLLNIFLIIIFIFGAIYTILNALNII